MRALIGTNLFALLILLLPFSAFGQSISGGSVGAGIPKNIIIIITDDYGTELWPSFDIGAPTQPTMPVLDSLANAGIRFNNHYGMARCHPFRVELVTGRYLMRTRSGLSGGGNGSKLVTYEWFLPEMIRNHLGDLYSMAQTGKFGVSPDITESYSIYEFPAMIGFDYYEGNIGASLYPSYHEWPETVAVRSPKSETTTTNTNYATTETADDAITWLSTVSEPWLLFVSFNAPHLPWCHPVTGVCSEPMLLNAKENAFLMMEAMDVQIGRVLDAAKLHDSDLSHTVVFAMADNGSVTVFSNSVLNGKGTSHERGVNVPLIIAHGGVENPGRYYTDPVSAVDISITVMDLVGAELPTNLPDSGGADADYTGQALVVDGVSLVGVMYGTCSVDPSCADPLHSSVFAETDSSTVDRVVKNRDGYKLKRSGAGPTDELFMLPDEDTDLCSGGCPTGLTDPSAALTAYTALSADMDTWEAAGP